MSKKRRVALWMGISLLFSLSACGNAGNHTQAGETGGDDTEVEYHYQLKAGEPREVSDVTFQKAVTVTIDPQSTRDGAGDLRSDLFFDNCTFREGLIIEGDYHAMISLGAGCLFDPGASVICREVSQGAARETTLEDNLVKVFVACEGVSVEGESAVGVLTDGPDVMFNGTVYSKKELAPDTDFLAIYRIYQGEEITYVKLAVGEDDSVEFLD